MFSIVFPRVFVGFSGFLFPAGVVFRGVLRKEKPEGKRGCVEMNLGFCIGLL